MSCFCCYYWQECCMAKKPYSKSWMWDRVFWIHGVEVGKHQIRWWQATKCSRYDNKGRKFLWALALWERVWLATKLEQQGVFKIARLPVGGASTRPGVRATCSAKTNNWWAKALLESCTVFSSRDLLDLAFSRACACSGRVDRPSPWLRAIRIDRKKNRRWPK